MTETAATAGIIVFCIVLLFGLLDAIFNILDRPK